MDKVNLGGNQALALAMCAYVGRLSPSSASGSTSNSTFSSTTTNIRTGLNMNIGLTAGSRSNAKTAMNPSSTAGRIAADLWYEQARTMLMRRMRGKGSEIEGVQGLLVCALRDQGVGRESQAWFLLGTYAWALFWLPWSLLT